MGCERAGLQQPPISQPRVSRGRGKSRRIPNVTPYQPWTAWAEPLAARNGSSEAPPVQFGWHQTVLTPRNHSESIARQPPGSVSSRAPGLAWQSHHLPVTASLQIASHLHSRMLFGLKNASLKKKKGKREAGVRREVEGGFAQPFHADLCNFGEGAADVCQMLSVFPPPEQWEVPGDGHSLPVPALGVSAFYKGWKEPGLARKRTFRLQTPEQKSPGTSSAGPM